MVATSREVIIVHRFFSNLTFVVNIVCFSSKRHDGLQDVKLDEKTFLLDIGELDTHKRRKKTEWHFEISWRYTLELIFFFYLKYNEYV